MKETFYHCISGLNTVAHLLTDRLDHHTPPTQEVPSVEENSRTHALYGQIRSKGEEENKATPTHSLLPNSPLSSNHSYLEVN